MPASETPTRDPQTFAIIGAAMEVHRTLGHGFLEAVYHEAMGLELGTRAIPFHSEVPLPVHFKGQLLGTRYRVDLVCFGVVVVELKAHGQLHPRHVAQTLNYLKASGLWRGLLINFGAPSLEFRRLVWGARKDASADRTDFTDHAGAD
ncbi:MAG: GxxExxY protein [Gemmatimonadota bacterium]